MELEWMGKHRASVEAMIRFGNVYTQIVNVQGYLTDVILISAAELQVLEYILENEDRHENMATVAQRLEISQSNFSKIVKQLAVKGLMEKYHTKGNNKNIIIKASKLGREKYQEYTVGAKQDWQKIFELLDKFSAADEENFQLVLHTFADSSRRRLDEFNRQENDGEELILID